jgi:hypothetical protein
MVTVDSDKVFPGLRVLVDGVDFTIDPIEAEYLRLLNNAYTSDEALEISIYLKQYQTMYKINR